MATTPVVTEPEVSILDIIDETMVLAVTKNLKKPDSALGFGELKEGNALWKRSQPVINEAGEFITDHIDTEIVHKVTVTFPVAHTYAGIQQIVPEEDEAVNLFSAGAYNKLMSQLRAYFTQVTEAGDLVHGEETVYTSEQSAEVIATPLKRRSISESAKLVKLLQSSNSETLMKALRELGILS